MSGVLGFRTFQIAVQRLWVFASFPGGQDRVENLFENTMPAHDYRSILSFRPQPDSDFLSGGVEESH